MSHKSDPLRQAIKDRVRAHLGNAATCHIESDGRENFYVVGMPSIQYFKAKTLGEAINMANQWKEMLIRE